MRPIKNKVLRRALYYAIDWNESLLDSYRSIPDDFKEEAGDKNWKYATDQWKAEIAAFKKLLGGQS